ncbi:chaplin family protein [Streptomyces sp. DH12]|uniref:chaplin family protein n=1 Tax=Streptomyces sp. DH12 TaxID=2857010 RepID=UPI0034D6725C
MTSCRRPSGTGCTNHHGTHAEGVTTHGTGAANGNLAGLPTGSPLNQCGGADLMPSGLLGPVSPDSLPTHAVTGLGVGMENLTATGGAQHVLGILTGGKLTGG